MKLIPLALLLAAGAAQAAQPSFAQPSFDCAGAEGAAETLICRDPELAALDRELARLWRLVIHGPRMEPGRLATLRAMQRGWIKGRNDCWKAADLRTCVRDETVLRLHELRRDHADARAEDEAGLTLGPFEGACPGADGLLVTFANSDPGAAAVQRGERIVVLDHVVSGSGARYAATGFDGRWRLWIKGDAASLETPDGAWTCRLSPPG